MQTHLVFVSCNTKHAQKRAKISTYAFECDCQRNENTLYYDSNTTLFYSTLQFVKRELKNVLPPRSYFIR